MKKYLYTIMILLVFAGCKKEPARHGEQEPLKQTPSIKKIVVAYNTWVGFGPMFIAKEKGYFKELGLDVEFRLMEDTGSKGVALKTGEVQMLGTTVDSFLIQAAQGVPAKIFMIFDQSNGADGVVAIQDIKTIADLKGKKVALQPGFVGHFFLLFLLDESGIDPKDVNIIPMETGDAGAAFVAGRVDAAVTWEPWLSKAKERPNAHVLVTSRERPGIIIDVFVARNDWLSHPQKRQLIKKFIIAWDKAVAFYRNNTEEAVKIIAKQFRLKTSEARDMLSGVILLNSADNIPYFKKPIAPCKPGSVQHPNLYCVVEIGSRLWKAANIIEKTKPTLRSSDIIDARFIQKYGQ